jgi:hypothetical protein
MDQSDNKIVINGSLLSMIFPPFCHPGWFTLPAQLCFAGTMIIKIISNRYNFPRAFRLSLIFDAPSHTLPRSYKILIAP